MFASPPVSGVSEHIRLPEMQPIPPESTLFPLLSAPELSFQLRDTLLRLLQQLNNEFQVYSDPASFNFYFPESKFQAVESLEVRNKINYGMKNNAHYENTFKDKLSEEQVEQIALSGEFHVRSNLEYIVQPYVWRINRRLYWGKQKMQEVWIQGLGFIFNIFHTSYNSLKTTVPIELNNIISIPKRIFGILFGSRRLASAITPDYQRQIAKDFWLQAIKKYYRGSREEGYPLWAFLFVNYEARLEEPIVDDDPVVQRAKQEERDKELKMYREAVSAMEQHKRSILAVHSEFMGQWGKISKRIFREISEDPVIVNLDSSVIGSDEDRLIKPKANDHDEIILDKLRDKMFTLYLDDLQANLPQKDIPPHAITAIVTLLRIIAAVTLKVEKHNKVMSEQEKFVREKVRARNPILCECPPYFQEVYNEEINPIRKSISEALYTQLQQDPALENHRGIFKHLVNFRNLHQSLLENKQKAMPELMHPARVFTSHYLLFPPYEVRKVNGYYRLIKQSEDISVDTSKNFWKFSLYLMRVKTWTVNFLIIALYSLWQSPLGFRCLFGISDFNYDPYCDSATGQVKYQSRSTFIGVFLTVLSGIKQSRDNFEAQPDEGLFGKKFSRCFNYIECYFFRFLFAGVIITLILYPILIIVFSVFSSILLITFWVWSPVILLATYLFNIFLFQFQTNHTDSTCWIRFTPFLRIIFIFIKSILMITLQILRTVILAPILAGILFLLRVIQRLLRYVSDCVMLFLISKLGRTPSRDSFIASKISGPGMSKAYYMSINENDVYILTQAQLQMIYMNKLHIVTNQRIKENTARFDRVMGTVANCLNSSMRSSGLLNSNANELGSRFNEQYNLYMARYPHMPYSIRFTQSEIDSIFPNTVIIVRNFVDKTGIAPWIFNDFHLDEGMYEQLTRAIWINVFNCGEEIFEPLQKIDERFNIEDQYEREESASMKRAVGSVMRALEGEVQLSHTQLRLAPFKMNLLNRAKQIVTFVALDNLHSGNSLNRVKVDWNCPYSILVPHLNIEELVKSDALKRSNALARYQTLIPRN